MTAAHKLAGSLGAFGLPRASRAAARLESLLSRATSSSASAMRLYRLIAHIATDLAQEPRRSLGAEDLRSEMATAAPTERVDFVVIDDDAVFAEAIAAWSLAYGYNTRCFGDGESAVLALAGETPSVQPSAILLDVDLPGLSGYDVLGRLESAGILARTPVIMLTQKSTSPDVLRALEYQIRGYVAKPVRMADLFGRLRSVVEDTSGLFIVGPARAA
jgi:CheY-like chemotaxis protein